MIAEHMSTKYDQRKVQVAGAADHADGEEQGIARKKETDEQSGLGKHDAA
jgi:hypothetical protein